MHRLVTLAPGNLTATVARTMSISLQIIHIAQWNTEVTFVRCTQWPQAWMHQSWQQW